MSFISFEAYFSFFILPWLLQSLIFNLLLIGGDLFIIPSPGDWKSHKSSLSGEDLDGVWRGSGWGSTHHTCHSEASAEESTPANNPSVLLRSPTPLETESLISRPC
jgi:hypothetical protein